MTCIGLAWTSPELVLLDLDRSQFRPLLARGAVSHADVEHFLLSAESQKPVVIVDGVHTLSRLSSFQGRVPFLVFDTVTMLRSVVGATILDHEPGQDDCLMKRITIGDIHAAIVRPHVPFQVPDNIVQVSAELAAKVTLRQLLDKVARRTDLVSEDFILRTCERIVGRITKATWVAKVRKTALAAGMDSQLLAEVERFVEDGSVSDGLWRGFYELVEEHDPMSDVLKRYDVREDDLNYLMSKLGSESVGVDNYASSPVKSKKRK